MKILLMSIGTRGDCEPFLGVGEMLRERGAEVTCAFPEQYRDLAVESGFSFFSLGSEFLDLMNGDSGRAMIGGSGVRRIMAAIDISRRSLPIQKKMLEAQHEIVKNVQPDRIIFHPKATYPIPWGLTNNRRVIMLATTPCVIHEVKGMAHVGINKSYGDFINGLSYALVRTTMVATTSSVAQRYWGVSFKRAEIHKALLEMPIAYNVSSTILPRPNCWPKNAIIAGFWERDKTVDWHPEQELNAFIERHSKILFITFGSMVNADPAGKTALFLAALRDCGIPAIINISGGGFEEPQQYDRNSVMFLKSAPYDWIFPKMYAIVHHGGAGTTHSALRAGCATMAVPHAVDQPMWDAFITKLGVGPEGIPISKLTRASLTAKLLDLFNNPSYRMNAEHIGAKMRNEDHVDELYRLISEQPD